MLASCPNPGHKLSVTQLLGQAQRQGYRGLTHCSAPVLKPHTPTLKELRVQRAGLNCFNIPGVWEEGTSSRTSPSHSRVLALREMQSNLCGAAGCVEASSGLPDVTVHHQDPWPPHLPPHAVQLNHTSRTCPEKFAELVTALLTSPGQRQPLCLAPSGLLHQPPPCLTPTPGPAALCQGHRDASSAEILFSCEGESEGSHDCSRQNNVN